VVVRAALTKQAEPFITVIAEREKNTAAYLTECFEVLCGKLKNNRIEYEYLAYPSLKDKIAAFLEQADYPSANKLFAAYVGKLHSLPKVKTFPVEFLRTIAGDLKCKKIQMDCLSRGPLDLTCRNILIDGQRWLVLDNEWSFDFPVPAAFILFRAVMEMAIAFQPLIRKNSSKSNPAAGIFARNLCTYYAPAAWVENLCNNEVGLRRLLYWEAGFQRYVTGSNHCSTGRIRRRNKIRAHFANNDLLVELRYLTRLKSLLKKIPFFRQAVYFLERKLLTALI